MLVLNFVSDGRKKGPVYHGKGNPDTLLEVRNEPCREKACLRGFRSGHTQTELYSLRSWLEA